MAESYKENKRPRRMMGVPFPKARYGVILAIIIIVSVNLIYYREAIFSFFK